uniref:Peptidase A2 domain-containing protein n=1 Tax=Trichuris muris TaxID=70415 RepID=A0A5S6QFS9_TRIMR
MVIKGERNLKILWDMADKDGLSKVLAAMAKQQEQQHQMLEALRLLISSRREPERSSAPSFPAYDKTTERWLTYIGRLEQHFGANRITDNAQKRAYLLSWIGNECFALFQRLFSREDFGQQSYECLVAALTEHRASKTHIIADLRGVAQDCHYVCDNPKCTAAFVDGLIRDMIILPTPHEQVRTTALQYANPSLDQVISIAQSFEASQSTTATIKGGSSVSWPEVHRVGKDTSFPRRHQTPRANEKDIRVRSCPSCWIQHTRSLCPMRKAICRKCRKVRHIAIVCLFEAALPASARSKFTQHQDKVKLVASEVRTLERVFSCRPAVISRSVQRQMWIDLLVNGAAIAFQVDTGATCSMIGLPAYRKLGSPVCEPAAQVLKSYGGQQIPVRGSLMVTVQCGSRSRVLPLLVTDLPNGCNLFGIDWFDAFNFEVSVAFPPFGKQYTLLVGSVEASPVVLSSAEESQRSQLGVRNLEDKYKSLFSPGLGDVYLFTLICN